MFHLYYFYVHLISSLNLTKFVDTKCVDCRVSAAYNHERVREYFCSFRNTTSKDLKPLEEVLTQQVSK